MAFFDYRGGRLQAEDVPVTDIAAQHGTPAYIYSRAALETGYRGYADALRGRDALVCYAIKANSNLAVLDILARLGAGFDIVSGGELERVVKAGGDPGRTVFSGVGKKPAEIARALELGILCFNLESAAELETVEGVAAQCGRTAPVSVRVNPDVDAHTHPYISTGLRENKFGVESAEALRMYEAAARSPHLEVVGMDCHIGSQLTDIAPYRDALQHLLALIDTLAARGIPVRHLDVGGGLGVRYRDESPPSIEAFVTAVCDAVGGRELTLVFEPGRSIAAHAGILVTSVDYLKPGREHNFARGAGPRGRAAPGGHRRPGMRNRGFPRQRPGPRPTARRPACGFRRRRLRFYHEFQLQQPRSPAGDTGGR